MCWSYSICQWVNAVIVLKFQATFKNQITIITILIYWKQTWNDIELCTLINNYKEEFFFLNKNNKIIIIKR